jgi:transcription elongation factor GreA
MSPVISLGSRVTYTVLGREQCFTLVAPTEASPAQGRLSVQAPVGRALLGHHAGETVMVRTPRGEQALDVLSVA